MPDHSAPPAMLAGFFYPYGLTDKQIILDCPDDIGYKSHLSILGTSTLLHVPKIWVQIMKLRWFAPQKPGTAPMRGQSRFCYISDK
ncbi:MAG: hypothetical protein DRH07_07625 [Deltaproteobacteria bacterium]|nr:MAG: hypothetical protein DRH07_07625 [Deltaproteobacteria bacterium]